MSTAAQIAANQKNAALSTGPRTPEGEAASSQNAMKAGATSAKVVLPFESQDEYDIVHRGFTAQLAPATPLERLIVEDIVNAFWRIRRIKAVQNSYVGNELNRLRSSDPLLATSAIMLSKDVQRLHRYETAYRREYESAWRRLQAVQKERKIAGQQEAEARRKAAEAQRPAQSPSPLQNEPDFTACVEAAQASMHSCT